VRRLVVCALVCCALASCKRERAARPTPAASASAARPTPLARVDAGMSEARVEALLGRPDEIRTDDGRRPWISGARTAWAYGVRAPGTLAFGGLVLFDAAGNVTSTRSPTDPLGVRARAIPYSESAVSWDRGLSCRLRVLSARADEVKARVTLENAGAAPFERRHEHTGIAFDLIIEIFGAEGRKPLLRFDTLSLFSPHAPGDGALMVIPPGSSLDAEIALDAGFRDLGPLPPGAYRARVAFPFEVGRFTPSEIVPFTIGG
jgi:hypothetical protein